MERQVFERPGCGRVGRSDGGATESWRELGFPSEEDMLDWLENQHPTTARPGRDLG